MSRPSPTLRRMAPFVGAATLLVVVALFLGSRGRVAEPAAVPPPRAVPAVAATVAPQPAFERRESTIGKRGTLAGALDDLGIEAPGEWVVAVDEIQDVRRLRPGTGVAGRFDATGPVTLVVRDAADRWIEVERTEDGRLAATRREVPTRVSVETAVGEVEVSVAAALSELDWGASLTHAFADIFQWDIDLLVDPRPGDRLRIVYEVERAEALPSEIPAFGARRDTAGAFLGLGRVLAARYDGERASSSAFWIEDDAGDGNYYDAEGKPLRKAFLKSPLNYRRISSGFSRARRHPVTGKVRPHYGVDFAAPRGTPVAATADGRVSHVGWLGGAGKAVKVRHGSEYETLYGHLSRYARGLSRGQTVRQGDVIGYVGSTGLATGPHLHYTLYISGRPVDPLRFKSPSVEPLPAELEPALIAAVYRWDAVMERLVPPVTVAEALAPSLSSF